MGKRSEKLTLRFTLLLNIGYAQWQVDRSQDDVYLATQESTGQHRDAQGEFNLNDYMPSIKN